MKNKRERVKLSDIVYNENADIGLIKRSLSYAVKKSEIKVIGTIFVLVLYLLSVLLLKLDVTLSGFKLTPEIFTVCSVLLQGISLFFGYSIISHGLSSIFKLKPDENTVFLLAFFSAFANSVLTLITKSYPSDNTKPFMGIGAILLFELLINKKNLYIVKRVKQNFKFEISEKEKYLVKLSESSSKGNSTVINEKLQHNYSFFDLILDKSFWEKTVQKLSFFAVILSVAVSTFSAIKSRNFLFWPSDMYTALMLCFPISFFFSLSFKLFYFSKKALKKGIMLLGRNNVTATSLINSITFDSEDLYPSENVILKEIKTFRGQRVDEAILYAATLSSAKEGPLNTVFNKVILGQKKMLTKVSEVTYEEDKGLIGWVNGKRVMIGNRDLLKSHGVDPSSRDYEDKYHKDNEGITYICVGYDLVAMFVLEYNPNGRLLNSLKSAGKNNIKIFIRTYDSNINRERISKDFAVSLGDLSIAPLEDSLSEKNNINNTKDIVFINKTLYLERYEYKYLPYIFMIRDGKTINDGISFIYQNNHLFTYDEVINKVGIDEINNTLKIANMCNIEFENKLYMPKYDTSNSKEFLINLANKGLSKRLNGNVSSLYKERLNHELDVIIKMHFEDYFLVVYDYIKFAKQNNILVGPGRGSAAGSLVCYSLGITDVDPFK